jgi:methylmalonyl-CoA mutase, N-terminal domain
VNVHPGDTEQPELVVHAPDPSVADGQRAQLAALRAGRDQASTDAALAALVTAARGQENLMPKLMDCARADATLGEMVGALRTVFGDFVEPAL